MKAAEDTELAGEPEAAQPADLTPITTRLDVVVDRGLARRLGPLEAKMDAVLAQQASAPAASAASALSSEATAAAKRARGVQAHAAAKSAKRGADGIPIYVLSTAKTTVQELWEEYTTGLNGGWAVCDLVQQYGKKWREYKDGKEMWAWHQYVYTTRATGEWRAVRQSSRQSQRCRSGWMRTRHQLSPS